VKHFASYEEGITYLQSRPNVERTRPEKLDHDILKLDRMHAMLGAMGDPHKATKFVHVAGSKGKGSTCEMIAACLTACGYTTGLYTSPHLVDIRERIRIGPDIISRADFLLHLGRAAAAAEAVQRKHGEPTYFELLTALAFSYFAEEAIDVAVVEVGLGGRLDSTNVITPEVCAITAIQLEHTQILGDTLEKIAREKAGIFKPNVPAITIPQKVSGVLDVFREVAGAVGAPLSILGEDLEFSCRFAASPGLGRHGRVCLTTKNSDFEHLAVPLMGEHQAWNCGLALAVLDALRVRGFKTPERKVAEGLAATPNHGRLEEISRTPHIVIDGAHNPESIDGLVHAIGAHIRPDSLVVIFGCAADKNVPGMLTSLSKGADKIIFTKSTSSPRAADPKELQRKFGESHSKMTQVAATLEDALSIAERAVHHGDLICVTGSFYLAGDAKKLLASRAHPVGGPTIEPKPPSRERAGR
jgi:dihydrofolate synthase/folylpolyglutamate synthase